VALVEIKTLMFEYPRALCLPYWLWK